MLLGFLGYYETCNAPNLAVSFWVLRMACSDWPLVHLSASSQCDAGPCLARTVHSPIDPARSILEYAKERVAAVSGV